MRLRARQHRFLLLVLGGWTAARVWALWPAALVHDPSALPHRAPAQAGAQHRDLRSWAPACAGAWGCARPAPAVASALRSGTLPQVGIAEPTTRQPGIAPGAWAIRLAGLEPSRLSEARSGRDPLLPTTPVADLAPTATRRLHAEAYLFLRQGSGRASLAAGGQLGASQAAARVTWALNPDGPERLALAARVYAPLATRGAEAALGLDWHPLPGRPLRLSVERRQRLDRAGRSAFSAYAAGGFYREPARGLVLDGYAQAGVVGLARRDLFVDGALRGGARAGRAVLGAGLWGAAQPGAARLDLGPRAAMTLPVADHALTVALEGRLRVAGCAAPGSGATLTIAAAF